MLVSFFGFKDVKHFFIVKFEYCVAILEEIGGDFILTMDNSIMLLSIPFFLLAVCFKLVFVYIPTNSKIVFKKLSIAESDFENSNVSVHLT